MNAAYRNAARAYASTGLESQIDCASPHQLVSMLLDGAIQTVIKAQRHLVQGETAAKGMAITKAIRIVDEGLRAPLNTQAGGELARQLHTLYGYIMETLLRANVRNDVNKLDEVVSLLRTVQDGWQQIDPNRRTQGAQAGGSFVAAGKPHARLFSGISA